LVFWDPISLDARKYCEVISPLCDAAPLDRCVLGVSATGNFLLFDPECPVASRVMPLGGQALAISSTSDFVITGCVDGLARLFRATDLVYVDTLPRPPPLGLFSATSRGDLPAYPATQCIRIVHDGSSTRVFAIYADRSFLIWDIDDPCAVVKHRSFLHHIGSIWDLQCLESPSADKIALSLALCP